MTGTVRPHRVITAKPEKVYRALIEPDVVASWLPPYGFLCTVQAACWNSISGHADKLVDDIDGAVARHGIAAGWSARSLALHTQAALQSAFILGPRRAAIRRSRAKQSNTSSVTSKPCSGAARQPDLKRGLFGRPREYTQRR